jgi:anti-sigma factor RsiW
MKITDKILSAWIDESLSTKKMKAVSAAVQTDPALQTRVEALRSVGNALREESFETPVSAERMAADVRRAIRLQEPASSPRFPLWARAGVAVCACLAIAAVLIPSVINRSSPVLQAQIESVNSGLSGVSTMVYTDYDAGWTVVWLDGAELETGL